MTIKEFFILVAALSEEDKTIGDSTILLQTHSGCWLELDTMLWTKDMDGRECLVLCVEEEEGEVGERKELLN